MSQVKRRIRQSFASASVTYDCVAKLQATAGLTLLQSVSKVNKSDVVLDLGCGTGFLSQSLKANGVSVPGHIIALDIAMPMLTLARKKLGDSHAKYVCADAEHLPFVNHSVDLVVSNFALQWCENLAGALGEVKRILKPGGHFIFTIFGENTLCELKTAWRSVDDYEHVNSFVDGQRLTKLLVDSGFTITKLTNENYMSVYQSVWDLMAELKQLGAQTVVNGRRPHLTPKSKMQQMIQAYQKQEEDGLVPATFEVISVVAGLDEV